MTRTSRLVIEGGWDEQKNEALTPNKYPLTQIFGEANFYAFFCFFALGNFLLEKLSNRWSVVLGRAFDKYVSS